MKFYDNFLNILLMYFLTTKLSLTSDSIFIYLVGYQQFALSNSFTQTNFDQIEYSPIIIRAKFMISLFFLCFCLASSIELNGTLAKVSTLSPRQLFNCTLSASPDNYRSRLSVIMEENPIEQLRASLNFSFDGRDDNVSLISKFKYNHALNLRVDTTSDVIIHSKLNAKATYLTTIYIAIRILISPRSTTFNSIQLNNTQILLILGKQNIKEQTYNLGQLPYTFEKINDSTVNLYPNTITDRYSYYSTINLLEILRTFCHTTSILLCNDKISSFQYELSDNRQKINTSYQLMINSIIIAKRQCRTSSVMIQLGENSIIHDVLDQKDAKEFANFSSNAQETNLREFRFDYQFKSNQGNFTNYSSSRDACSLKAVTSIKQGFSFPIKITNNTVLTSLNMTISLISTMYIQAQVCVFTRLRNDYDDSNKNFMNSPTKKQVEINVCFWSSISDLNRGDLNEPLSNKSILDKPYSYYNLGQKHYYIQSASLTPPNISKTNFNLSAFIEPLKLPPQFQIWEIQHTIRVYCGTINFSNIQISISQRQNQPPGEIQNYPIQNNEYQDIKNESQEIIEKSYQVDEKVNKTISNIFSLPDIGLLLRLVQILNLLDDLSYFSYHNATYDAAFTYVSDLSWGWVNAKWLPPEILQNGSGWSLSSGAQPGWVPFRVPVPRFQIKGQRMAFLDNCKGYLLYTMPTNTILFLILWKIYWRFKEHKLIAVLSHFGSFAYLALSLICDNGQYLAFRSFQQLRSLEPTNSIAILSSVLAVIALFFATFCSFGLFMAAHRFACKLFKPPTLLRSINSYKYFGVWTGARFIAGFVHAVIDDPLNRICMLLAIQLLVVVSTGLSWHSTQIKTPHTALIFSQIVRLLLYSLACLQVVFPQLTGPLDKYGKISDISSFLIQVMFYSTALQIALTLIVGAAVTPQKDVKDPKQNMQERDKQHQEKQLKQRERTIIKANPIRSTTRKLAENTTVSDKLNEVHAEKQQQSKQQNNRPKGLTRLIIKAKTIIRKTRKAEDESKIEKVQQEQISEQKKIHKTLNLQLSPAQNSSPTQCKSTAFIQGNELYLAKKIRQKMLINKMKEKERWLNQRSKEKMQKQKLKNRQQ